MALNSKSAIQELLDRSGLEQANTRIDVLELNLSPGASPVWHPGLDDSGILPYLMDPVTPTLRVFFITSIRNGFEGFYQYINGWTDTGPASVWFSHQMDTGSSTYFLVDCPEGAKIDILRSAASQDTHIPLFCPFVIDLLIANECASSWRALVDEERELLLDWENNGGQGIPLQSIIYTPSATERLHGLFRNFRTIVEDVEDLRERLDFLIEIARKHESVLSNSTSSSSIQTPALYPAIENLEFLSSRCRIWKRWIANYGERTQLMMNLFFSIASQMDNRNNLDIANLTSKIAIETKRDSSSMITIAAVTMIFLPGTFISAVFSMVFFSLGTNRAGQTTLNAAPQLWYYFVITIPLTGLVFAVWQWWRRRRQADMGSKKQSGELSQEK
ncbi:MAG: hypothetical protein Q9187_001096 [Circinaria calcarea]